MFLVLIAVSTTMAIAVSAAAWRTPPQGIDYLALTLWVYVLVYVLFVVREPGGLWLGVWLPNVLLATALSTFGVALLKFHQSPVPRLGLLVPIIAVAISFAVFLENAHSRVLLGAMVYVMQSSYILRILLKHRRETAGVGQYYLIIAFISYIALFVFRLIALLMDQDIRLTASDEGGIQTLTYVSSVVNLVLLTLGMLLMAKERSDANNLRMAMQDELTGLANRRQVMMSFEHLLAAARRTSDELSVVVFDIDFFKRINDTHGHPAGDAVLRQVAHGLKSRLRGQDIAGRIGGEEFLVLLPHTNLDGGIYLAEELRHTMESLKVTSPQGIPIPVTISLGVCSSALAKAGSVDTLLAAADAALYRAKSGGRNRVEHAA